MDVSSLLLAVVFGAVVAFLYWLYSFAVAPFRVLARHGILGPQPGPFYGNYRMIVKMGRLNFQSKMLEKYGKVFG